MAIPLNTPVVVLMISGEQIEGEVAMIDQGTYLCLRRDAETVYLPWTAIKCVRGPALPQRMVGNPYSERSQQNPAQQKGT